MAAPTGPSDRQLARERGESLLDQVAERFLGVPGVQAGRMFNGRGLSVDDSIFVFINREGRMVAKLPEPEAQARVAAGDADVVTMGTRTMREWVSFAQPTELDSWVAVARDAHRYVSALTP